MKSALQPPQKLQLSPRYHQNLSLPHISQKSFRCTQAEFPRAWTPKPIAHTRLALITSLQLSLDAGRVSVTGRRAQENHNPFPWVCFAPEKIKADTISQEMGTMKAAPTCNGAVTTEHLL